MYNLQISLKAVKEIKKLERKHQEAVIEALKEIRENPLSGKPLTRELTGRFSYRVGIYRIIYKVNQKDHIIVILTAGHRSSVYG